MRVLLTAEIDADSEAEAQRKLDELRDYLADTGPSVYDGISIFRTHRVEVKDAITTDDASASKLVYYDPEDFSQKVPAWQADEIEA